MLEAAGAVCHLLPIARDSAASLQAVFGLAAGVDLVVPRSRMAREMPELVGRLLAT